MAELREARRIRIARVEVRRSVVRREEDERVEEVEHMVLVRVRETDEVVARVYRLAAVTLDHLAQIDAPPVVAIGGRRAHAPERRRQELFLQRPVVGPLVEVRAEVVALAVGEDVTNERGAVRRTLQRRESARGVSLS